MKWDYEHVHVKRPWKGLDVASVLTAYNIMYTVAVGINEKNENHHFIWMGRHRLPCDWQKGVLEALSNISLENHSCFCAVHRIFRNVHLKHGGKPMWK
jgi:hypothetical protein